MLKFFCFLVLALFVQLGKFANLWPQYVGQCTNATNSTYKANYNVVSSTILVKYSYGTVLIMVIIK